MIHNLSAQNVKLGIKMSQDLELMRADIKVFMDQFRHGSADNENAGIQLADRLSRLHLGCDAFARTNDVLGSLVYDTIYHRHSQIVEAHAKTFEWIFDEDRIDIAKSSTPALSRWLQSGDGIYWISGKPGSGKSTLVKWICEQAKTFRLLQTWAGEKTLVVSTHFFWSVGTDMQKSQEGLLRSLLFEALRGCPSLIPQVVGGRWDEGLGLSHQRPWTIRELRQCFTRLAAEGKHSVAFCFFVDGLDEYSGEHDEDYEEVIAILQTLAKSRHVKICVSSRPWNVFQAAFSHLIGQRLKLEDLTEDDIRLFTRERLGQNPKFRKLAEREPRCETLVDDIAEAADGVFLWVFLVVRSLLQGLTNADRLSNLQRRLLLLPRDLGKLFLHMLNTTDEVYHEDQARFFTITHHAHGPLSLTTYSYIDDEDPGFALDFDSEPESTAERLDRLIRTKIRLNAQCNGLLECISTPKSADADRLLEMTTTPPRRFFSPVLLSKGYQVRFLHRTVRDFIATPEVGRLLSLRCPQNFQPSVCICLAILAEFKKLDFSIADERLKLILPHLLGQMATYLHEAEVKYSMPMVDVVDALQEVFAKMSPDVTAAVFESSNAETLKTISTKCGQLGFQTTAEVSRRVILQFKAPGLSYFVIQSRLLLYAQHKLERDWASPEMTDLILCALLPSAKHLLATHTSDEELAMLETLLDHFGSSVLWDSPRVMETRNPQLATYTPEEELAMLESEARFDHFGASVLWDSPRVTETRNDQTFERYVASRWLIFLGVVADIWSNADTENLARDDLIHQKMAICLKAGADPNARELGNKASPPMLVRLLMTASSMVGIHTKPHTLVYRILELFLKHGADLQKDPTSENGVRFTLRRDIYTSLDDDDWQLAMRFGYVDVEPPPQEKEPEVNQYGVYLDMIDGLPIRTTS